MYEIGADQKKNRLYVCVAGFLGQAELKEAADEFIAKVKTLRSPVDVINDVSAFRPSTPEGSAEIKRAQTFLAEFGVRHVVRIVEPVPEEGAGFERAAHTMGAAQFRRTAREVGLRADEAQTREEAEAMLDKMIARETRPGPG